MKIEKNGITYDVIEREKAWVLSAKVGCVPVQYNVSKADCLTLEDLRAFVAENSTF